MLSHNLQHKGKGMCLMVERSPLKILLPTVSSILPLTYCAKYNNSTWNSYLPEKNLSLYHNLRLRPEFDWSVIRTTGHVVWTHHQSLVEGMYSGPGLLSINRNQGPDFSST